MKKLFVLTMLLGLAVIVPVLADEVAVGDLVYFTPGNGVSPIPPILHNISNPEMFQTFCLELNENLTFGAAYPFLVDNIGNAAIEGGLGGPHPDPISQGTAWLYGKYRTDALSSYVPSFDPTIASHVQALQHVIWVLEQERDPTFLTTAIENALYAAALANGGTADYTGTWVKVVNIVWTVAHDRFEPGDVAQSVLMVPEPSLLLLLGAGLLGVGAFSRRRR